MSNPAEDINQWAEKLQQVTLPDDSQSWRQMEALLDKEMPLVKNNNLRRWLLLVILLLLLIGVCNCPGIMTTNKAIPKNGEPVASGPVSETKQVISSRIKDLDSFG